MNGLQPGYTPRQQELYSEAGRTVIAIAAARIRGDQDGVKELYRGYFAEAEKLGQTPMMAWSIFAVAAVMWVTNLLQHEAAESEDPVEDVLAGMIGAAQEWASGRT